MIVLNVETGTLLLRNYQADCCDDLSKCTGENGQVINDFGFAILDFGLGRKL